jgi:cysteine desulfurase/selenocysteine lyase
VHLDAAQAFAGGSIDVAEDRPDFVSFSLHKAYGPSGLGGLYIRREWQPRLLPWISGAGTVDDHFEETSTWAAGAARFEFGLQNYAAIFAVPAAMAFLSDISQGALNEHAAGLNMELRDALRRVPDCHSVGPLSGADAHHICSFHVRDTDSKRLASLLDMAANIQVRAGRLCAHHWFHRYGVPDVIRVSLGGHNSISDVEEFVNALVRIRRHYM